MVNVIPRSEWGAQYPDGGGPAPVPFAEWWLHHSATIAPDLAPPFDDEYAAMRTLEAIGQQRFAQGISYTFPIMPNGRVYQGHSINRLGAHTANRNGIARAICLVGNYDITPVTAAQIESAAQLMVQEYRAGRAKRYTLNGGHRQLKATSCPGNNGFAAIPAINARAEALMAGAPPMQEDELSAQFEAEARQSINHLNWNLTPAIARMDERTAQLVAAVAGLSAAVSALAANSDLSAADLEAAVERGTAKALRENVVTVDVDVTRNPT